MKIWPCFICGVETACKHREPEIYQHVTGFDRDIAIASLNYADQAVIAAIEPHVIPKTKHYVGANR